MLPQPFPFRRLQLQQGCATRAEPALPLPTFHAALPAALRVRAASLVPPCPALPAPARCSCRACFCPCVVYGKNSQRLGGRCVIDALACLLLGPCAFREWGQGAGPCLPADAKRGLSCLRALLLH